MILLKNEAEILKMAQGGKILAKIFKKVMAAAKPGSSTQELDKFADDLFEKSGGKPSFKMVPGYKFATCLGVNEVVVHGIPTSYRLKPGDLLGLDMGFYFQGYHTDMAETIIVEEAKFKEDKAFSRKKFLATGQLALKKAIKTAWVGKRIGDISLAIQKTIEGAGYSVVRSLVGHGVGKKLHEDPLVPGFLAGKKEKTPLLQEGMTLAIEVIYNEGQPQVTYKNNDKWTIITQDKSLSGLFERTIALTKNGPIVLTQGNFSARI